MEVYRLAHARYKDLSGAGGVYGSGRWHNKGQPILYTASSRSLAALERFVHESALAMPKLKMLTIWIPDNLTIARYNERQLPQGWDLLPDSEVSRNFGSQWLLMGKEAGLQIPSAIIKGEFNLILNPLHSEARSIKTVDEVDFYYDARLQKMIR